MIVLLITFGVYAWRDILPLGTFTKTPVDAQEGWLIWTKLGILGFTAVVIPLLIPRTYDPVDPNVGPII